MQCIVGNAETLIKLSQIRRMCRLLVSVCNSKTQEATGDSSGKNNKLIACY